MGTLLSIGHAAAQGDESPRTTWAVRVASDSHCAEDREFLETLTQQIPEEQRASADQAELTAVVKVTTNEGGLSATVTVIDRMLDSEAGARELQLPVQGCRPTAEAIALVLGVLVEAGRGVPPPATPEPPPEPPEEPPPPASPAPPVEGPTRYRWLGPRAGHDLMVGAGPGFGLLPDMAWGGTLAWGVRLHDGWPFWLAATGFLPNQTDDGRARLSAVNGSVAICPIHRAVGHFRLFGCPTFAMGALWAAGRGFLQQKNTRGLLALAGVELVGDAPITGPWLVGLRLRVEVPLIRARFVYYRKDGAEPQLHQASILTGAVILTTGVRFR